MTNKILILTTLLTLVVSCGKDNKSGQGYSGQFNYANVSNNPYVSTVMNENPCSTGLQRVGVQVPMTGFNVAPGSTYVGVTSEGDVAVVTSDGTYGVFTAYVCGRSGMGGNSQLQPGVVINRSNYCSIDEITSATMVIGSTYGNFTLNFRAIHYGRGSSLCQY